MNSDRLWELLGLKLSGEANEAELEELELHLVEHPEEKFRVDTFTSLWNTTQKEDPRKKEAYNRHMQRLSSHLSNPVLQYENPLIYDDPADENKNVKQFRRKKLLWLTGIAASLITAILIINPFQDTKSKSHPNAQNTVSTKKGSKSKIVLPDGTQVWLNADSRITYNEDFQRSIREVELSGEAFFEVVRDESRPFIIHTSVIDVKVLGTSFNVRSYASEKNTETSLIRGSVEITLLNSPDMKKIILKPSDKLIVSNNSAIIAKQPDEMNSHYPIMTLDKIRKKDSIAIETSWINNKLAFDEETLEEIGLKIERWFDVNLNITDNKLKYERYTATFEDKSLVEVLEALQKSGGFIYSINKKDVTISKE